MNLPASKSNMRKRHSKLAGDDHEQTPNLQSARACPNAPLPERST
jgi:hypothetical protein